MSRLFPHAPFAEDQPLSHLILTTHVLHRGFQSGALVGAILSPLPLAYRRMFPSSSANAVHAQNQKTPSSPSTSLPRPVTGRPGIAASFLPSRLLPWTGIGGLVGFGAVAVMLPLMMRGKEGIEWQDRAWRLLANRGQLEVDDWSLAGVAAGIAGVVWASRGAVEGGWRGKGWRGAMRVVGGAGVGSLVGVGGMLVWRAVWPRGE